MPDEWGTHVQHHKTEQEDCALIPLWSNKISKHQSGICHEMYFNVFLQHGALLTLAQPSRDQLPRRNEAGIPLAAMQLVQPQAVCSVQSLESSYPHLLQFTNSGFRNWHLCVMNTKYAGHSSISLHWSHPVPLQYYCYDLGKS